MKKIFLLLPILYSSFIHSQNLSLADSIKKNGDITKALNEYIKVLSLDTLQLDIHIEIARCFSLLGYTEVAFTHLKKGIKQDSSDKWLIEPDFLNLCETPQWDTLVEQQISKMKITGQVIKNPSLAKTLWNMAIKDQAYYYHLKVAMKNDMAQSILFEHFWQLKFNLNEQNLKDLQILMDKDGWPKISEVDTLAAKTAFYIIQHSDYEIQKKYHPILEKAVKNSEATKKELAYLTDRILVYEGKPQLYGSQSTRNLETGEIKISPIKDPENLNKRRKEMGMEPLKNW